MVAERLSVIGTERGPFSADRARATLSAFFAWSWREGLVEANPVAATNRNAGKPRERVLAMTELADIWRAAGACGAFGGIVKLLILTGQRRMEIGSLQWCEIDLAARLIRLPAEDVRNPLVRPR